MTKSELIELLADVEDDADILIGSENWGRYLEAEKIEIDDDAVLLIVDY